MIPPAVIGNADLICYAFTYWHQATGFTAHYARNFLLPPANGLAICQYQNEGGFYLFYCDEQWVEFADTWHESIEDCKDQAELEYAGIKTSFVEFF